MSTEATGDARPDAADQAEQAMAGVSTRSGEVSGAGRGTGGAARTGEDDEPARGDVAGEDATGDSAAGDFAGGTDGGADGAEAGFTEPGSPAGDGAPGDGAPGDRAAGDGAGDAEDDALAEGLEAEPEDVPDDADAPAELIDRAEPVELDEAAQALRPARRWTRVLVVLGFVVLAAAIVGGAIAIVGSVTHGFKKPVKVTYKTSAVFSLKTGDCFDPQGAQSYTLVSCDAPHDAEVFATFALTGTSWPGASAVQAKASGGCASRLTGYVNPQLAISLTSTYVYPDSVAWQAGTRSVICEVRATTGQLTGSVQGATATATASASASAG
jgi:hypothetical protein